MIDIKTTLITLATAAVGLTAALAPQQSEAAAEFPREVFEELDYGLYWFGDDETYAKANPLENNPYYSADRPTIIYVHGWQSNTTELLSREALNWESSKSPDIYVAQAWLDAGWNVGVMYWNQMADEGNVADAEAKIWSTQGPQGMRWRDVNGEYHDDGPDVPASQLFYEAYRDAMADYRGDTVRIAGHSLGNQMAVNVTKRIVDGVQSGELAANLMPGRVALLDPYYSSGGKDYLEGRWTGEMAREYVQQAKDAGIVFELYRTSLASSAVGVADANPGLVEMCAYVELLPWYFAAWQLTEKHVAAPWHYFWSVSFEPPEIRDSDDVGMSASTSDERIAELMNSNQRLEHYLGMWTPTPGDDIHEYHTR